MTSPPSHLLAALVRRLAHSMTLTAEARQAIEALPTTVRDLAANADLVRPGDRAESCCIVVSGWMGCLKLLRKGQRQFVAVHIEGDMPDLHSLHLPTADFGICALTDATVALVPHGAVRALMAQHPDVAAALWREVLVTASIAREWMVGLGRRQASERMAHLLCELYVRQRAAGLVETEGRCALPLTQTALADGLGLTPVHVNRTLRDLRRAGLADLNRRVLVIRDWTRLCAVAEFDPLYLHLDREGG